jgi:hypothetical protein
VTASAGRPRGHLGDVLDDLPDRPARRADTFAARPATLGLVVLHRASGIRGRLQRLAGDVVELLDAQGRRHQFRNVAGAFAVDGETVVLLPPPPPATNPSLRRSGSGAVVDPDAPARVARAGRLWVEGDHDAALLERVWGDELRDLAIVVEPLRGIDNLVTALEAFGPGPGRVVVVLVDHLLEGTREQRMADAIRTDHVHVVGHPFVDVWQCVRPVRLGIPAWPSVPRGEDWKTGVCSRLGWGTPHSGWRRVLAGVESIADLDASLVNAVETALDLLTEAAAG